MRWCLLLRLLLLQWLTAAGSWLNERTSDGPSGGRVLSPWLPVHSAQYFEHFATLSHRRLLAAPSSEATGAVEAEPAASHTASVRVGASALANADFFLPLCVSIAPDSGQPAYPPTSLLFRSQPPSSVARAIPARRHRQPNSARSRQPRRRLGRISELSRAVPLSQRANQARGQPAAASPRPASRHSVAQAHRRPANARATHRQPGGHSAGPSARGRPTHLSAARAEQRVLVCSCGASSGPERCLRPKLERTRNWSWSWSWSFRGGKSESGGKSERGAGWMRGTCTSRRAAALVEREPILNLATLPAKLSLARSPPRNERPLRGRIDLPELD